MGTYDALALVYFPRYYPLRTFRVDLERTSLFSAALGSIILVGDNITISVPGYDYFVQL